VVGWPVKAEAYHPTTHHNPSSVNQVTTALAKLKGIIEKIAHLGLDLSSPAR
jgi:hypothetical protein